MKSRSLLLAAHSLAWVSGLFIVADEVFLSNPIRPLILMLGFLLTGSPLCLRGSGDRVRPDPVRSLRDRVVRDDDPDWERFERDVERALVGDDR